MDTRKDGELELEADAFELDSDESEDLETAMMEALEALEGGREETAAESTVEGPAPPVVPEPEDERSEDLLEATEWEEPGEAEVTSDTDELGTLRREVAELRDRSVRTLADFDNFRKRVERERDDQDRYAGLEVLREVLAIVDNLERALESEGGLADLKEGVGLILRQLLDLLRRHGVERIKAVGEVFDPTIHEAVSRLDSDDVSVPAVQEELQSGFIMHDRLLRPAMVVVAVPADSGENGDQGLKSG